MINSCRQAIIIEDSKTVQLHIKNLIEPLNYEVNIKNDLSEVNKLLDNNINIDIAIVSLDVYLEDLEKIVDLLIKYNIGIILLSGSEEPSIRDSFLKKDIIDYIEKDSLSNFSYITKILKRLDVNIKVNILVVDDSRLYRQLISNNLKRHRFNVIEASDGEQALDVLKKNKDINLIITDYEMPNLDGLGVIKAVRKEYDLEQLPIIVVSSLDSSSTIVDCLKNGANDYLHKPFGSQELYSRLYLTLSHKENIDVVKEQKSVYEKLFHKSSNAILLMRNGLFIDCNEAALKFLKLDSKEEILNKTSYDFSPEVQPDGQKSLDKIDKLENNKSERFDWLYLQSDKTPIWVDVLRTPITINGEEVIHVVWHDISNTKQLEIDLENLNRSLEKRIDEEVKKNSLQSSKMLAQSRLAQMGEMISMIAHQWRQPLSSISAISSTLNLDIIMDNYDSEFFQERLSSIDELSQHLSSTIDDFRGFFKDNKKTEETSITNIIDGTLQIIGSTLKTQAVELTLDITSDTKTYTYVNEIKQVVLNILKNAEDALLDKKIVDKKVTIKGFSDKEYIYIVIEDNASGIPEDILKNIFDPYFSTKTAKDGTGLGLYMSKTIVEDHCHGQLNVKNGEHGAEFTIMLPIKTVDE